jgi:hypothetical protein
VSIPGEQFFITTMVRTSYFWMSQCLFSSTRSTFLGVFFFLLLAHISICWKLQYLFTCLFHWNKMHSWITAFCLKNLGPTKYWKIVFAIHATLRNKSKDLIGIEIKCRNGSMWASSKKNKTPKNVDLVEENRHQLISVPCLTDWLTRKKSYLKVLREKIS